LYGSDAIEGDLDAVGFSPLASTIKVVVIQISEVDLTPALFSLAQQ
jgi:hypothetical protein